MAEEPQTEQLSEEIKTLIRGALPLRRVIRMLTGDRIRILAVFSSSKVMAKWKNSSVTSSTYTR
jgi:hypothetical protein